ncbi:uncharacterized protein [Henckelia pumila]|uniref:uncharacterized protein n=1 Tax=Henckelia pumila TaxID=405737 RepID=UPI003C6E469D
MLTLLSQAKMGSAIVDLYALLVSKKKQEQITLKEANLMMSWQSQTLRNSMIGCIGGATVSMLVTPRRLNILVRASLSLGASFVCTLWNFGRSLESWTDRFLSMEGSRIQIQLANIMLKRYGNDPWVLRRLSKHFYLEEVYEDSSVDKPKTRWQSRYFFGDSTTHFQNTSYDETNTDSSKNDNKKTTVESEEVYANDTADASQSPFDFVFGLPGCAENIPPKTSSTSSGRSSLRERRARRRRRRRHQEDSDV